MIYHSLSPTISTTHSTHHHYSFLLTAFSSHKNNLTSLCTPKCLLMKFCTYTLNWESLFSLLIPTTVQPTDSHNTKRPRFILLMLYIEILIWVNDEKSEFQISYQTIKSFTNHCHYKTKLINANSQTRKVLHKQFYPFSFFIGLCGKG